MAGRSARITRCFLTEFCDLLDVPHPDIASHATVTNDHVVERVVKETTRDGAASNKRIDLYKRDCVVPEAKQSRFSDEKTLGEAMPGW